MKYRVKRLAGDYAVADGEWAVVDAAGYPYVRYTDKAAATKARAQMNTGRLPNTTGPTCKGCTDYMDFFEEVV